MFSYLKKKYNKKMNSKCLSLKYYYELLFDIHLTRDPITGLFGMDIHEPYAMVMWTIPGLPAYNMGIFPRDLLYAIDDILVKPGDSWYYKYLLYRNTVKITVIPTNRFFEKPKLKRKLVRTTYRMGDIITRDLSYIETLSLKGRGKNLNRIQNDPRLNITDNLQRTHEVQMNDIVYI